MLAVCAVGLCSCGAPGCDASCGDDAALARRPRLCDCNGTRRPAGGDRCGLPGIYVQLGSGHMSPPLAPTPLELYTLPRSTCYAMEVL